MNHTPIIFELRHKETGVLREKLVNVPRDWTIKEGSVFAITWMNIPSSWEWTGQILK